MQIGRTQKIHWLVYSAGNRSLDQSSPRRHLSQNNRAYDFIGGGGEVGTRYYAKLNNKGRSKRASRCLQWTSLTVIAAQGTNERQCEWEWEWYIIMPTSVSVNLTSGVNSSAWSLLPRMIGRVVRRCKLGRIEKVVISRRVPKHNDYRDSENLAPIVHFVGFQSNLKFKARIVLPMIILYGGCTHGF